VDHAAPSWRSVVLAPAPSQGIWQAKVSAGLVTTQMFHMVTV
jgi:hypothetical protein